MTFYQNDFFAVKKLGDAVEPKCCSASPTFRSTSLLNHRTSPLPSNPIKSFHQRETFNGQTSPTNLLLKPTNGPYLSSRTSLHKIGSSIMRHHFHFAGRLKFTNLISLTPSPPFLLVWQIVLHFTQQIFLGPPTPPQRILL